MELLLATANPAKAREFRHMLASDRLAVREMSEFPEQESVAETGHTFRANACQKAVQYARRHHMWALTDDSGLEVDGLEGAPGVTSARWAELHGRGKGDADNNKMLIEQLKDVPDDRRSARFVCVLALSDPDGRVMLTSRGAVGGVILRAPRGSNGFGYDPLFYVPELRRTTAELAPEEKHRISHRGKAVRRIRELMSRTGLAN